MGKRGAEPSFHRSLRKQPKLALRLCRDLHDAYPFLNGWFYALEQPQLTPWFWLEPRLRFALSFQPVSIFLFEDGL
jgi:hypothetical protein